MSQTISQVTQIAQSPTVEMLFMIGRALALVGGLLIFAWAFRHWRRSATHDTQRVFEQLDLVRAELLIMKEVMHHAAHRVDAPAPNPTSTHREVAIPAPMATNGRGYEMAARMARNGAGRDELIRTCGITSHEAELLIKLHGRRTDVVPATNAKATAEQAKAAAQLIGRQPRAVDPRTASSPTAAQARPVARQAATVTREPQRAMPTRSATTETANNRVTAQSSRSRLFAVG